MSESRVWPVFVAYLLAAFSIVSFSLVAMIIVLVFPHQHLVEHVPDTASASSPGGR